MWYLLKSEYSSRLNDPTFYWPRPKELFEQNPNRNLGYVMSYWYLENKEEIDEWVNSSDVEGVFIDVGDRSKTYKHKVGGFFLFRREPLQEAIDNNKELLSKYGIPTNVDGFVEAVATKAFHQEDIYNFIATQFGDKNMRASNPLKVHRRLRDWKGNKKDLE